MSRSYVKGQGHMAFCALFVSMIPAGSTEPWARVLLVDKYTRRLLETRRLSVHMATNYTISTTTVAAATARTTTRTATTTTPRLKKLCQCYFLITCILIILARKITKKIDVNDCGFAHLTLILLLHYLVKSRSRSLVVYNNEFVLGSACVGSENHCEETKSLRIVTCLTLIVSTLISCCQT